MATLQPFWYVEGHEYKTTFQMKKYCLLCLILCMTTCVSVEAQHEKKKKWSLASLYLQLGAVQQREFNLGLQDYRSLVPQSNLLKQDFSDKKLTTSQQILTHPLLTASLVFDLPSKMGWQLRVGGAWVGECTSYANFIHSDYNYFASPTRPDTVRTTFFNALHERVQIRMDASLVKKHKIANSKRWNFQSGLGLSVNLTYNAYTEVSQTIFYDIKKEVTDDVPYTTRESKFQNTVERFEHAPQLSYALFVPFGAEWQMKKGKSWYLVYELRPTVQISKVGKFKTIAHLLAQHNIGFRKNFGI